MQHPEGDEDTDVGRQGTGGGEEGESDRADQEQPAPAEDVAKPGPGDEQDGKGQGIAGAEPLDGVGPAAEVVMERRGRRR